MPEPTQTQPTQPPQPPTEQPPQPPQQPAKPPVEAVQKKPVVNRGDVEKLLPQNQRDVVQNMDDNGTISLPYGSFIERVNRAGKSELKKLFGTDDVKSILAMKTEYENLKKEKEAAEEARMSEIERERKKAAQALQAQKEWEQKYNKLEQKATANEVSGMLKGIAAKHVDMRYIRHILRDLAEDLTKNYTSKQISQFSERHIEQWFKKYVQNNPAYAAQPVQPTNNQQPKKPATTVKKPITNGPANKGPTPQSQQQPTQVNGKDVRPGKSNSMTAEEFRAYKASLGITVLRFCC